MAFENVRPFILDTTKFDNALASVGQAAKQYAQDQSTAEAAGLVAKGDRNALMGWAQRNPSNPLAVQYTNALAKDVLNPPKADPLFDLKRRKLEAETKRLEGGPAPMNEATRIRMQLDQERLKKMQQGDPVRDMIVERLRARQGGQAGQTMQPPAQPKMVPQSAPGGMSPNVKLISDETAQPAAPAMPQQPDMVDTPLGRMSRQEASDLGGMMMMDPKYATVGRALYDAATAGQGGMSKPAQNQLDERTISAASGLGRLQEIKRQFKPEFLKIPDRLKMLGTAWGAKLGGKLPPQDEAQLRDFARFKAAAFDNFNQLLKEMSGTAVSAQELSRNQIVQPNPGEGLFDGDDPVTFMSKIEQGERMYRSAIARMNFMRSQGLSFNKETAEQFLRLEDVPNAIRQRGSQIEQELLQSNPQADPMAIQEETKRRLKQEFGI